MGSVFVTGMAGFLGSHVAEHFRDRGWQVRGIDNLTGGEMVNVPDGVDFTQADCLDREKYQHLIDGADAVYHCAASAYDGFSVFSPAMVFRDTVQATVESLVASISGGAGRFINCSSMARYGDQAAPFTEDMTPRPVTPYGIAKVAAEDAVRCISDLHGLTYVIAVPHNIIGPRQRFDDPYRNVAAIMINRMLRGQQPVIYGDGSSLRCFSFVSDVLQSLVSMGTADNVASEVINVGPDEGAVTILELAQSIAGLLAFDLDPVFVPARPREVAVATCSADKSRRLLGYQTQVPLLAGLEEMVTWIAKAGPREFRYDREIEVLTAQTPRTWTDHVI